MPYTAEISRTNPACVLILIDQSGSMDGPFAGAPEKKKSEGVADAVNRLIQNMVLKCAKIDGVRDYFHVGLIGYGGELTAGLGTTLPDDVLVPISQLADRPIRVETRIRHIDDGAGGVVEHEIRGSLQHVGVAIGLAEGRTLELGEIPEPSDALGADRFVASVDDEVGGLVIVAVKFLLRRVAVLLQEADTADGVGMLQLLICRHDLGADLIVPADDYSPVTLHIPAPDHPA